MIQAHYYHLQFSPSVTKLREGLIRIPTAQDVQQIPPRIERGQKGRVGETMDPDQYMVGSVIEGARCYNRKYRVQKNLLKILKIFWKSWKRT